MGKSHVLLLYSYNEYKSVLVLSSLKFIQKNVYAKLIGQSCYLKGNHGVSIEYALVEVISHLRKME